MKLMRDRKDIEEEITESNAENNGQDTVALLQLEVLLDIRDLLIMLELYSHVGEVFASLPIPAVGHRID